MLDSATCEFAQLDGGEFAPRLLYYGPGPQEAALEFARTQLTYARWKRCKFGDAVPRFVVRVNPDGAIQIIACCPMCSSASLISKLVE